jgi:hypothetical protein
MPELSDFLGHILEEITRARIQADLEAIRTAKMYAADETGLLKNFAVPRMRLPNIEISAPVIIIAVPEGFVEKTDANLLSTTVANDLQEMLSKQQIKIDIAQIVEVIRSDEFLSKGHISDVSAATLSNTLANQIRQNIDTRSSADSHKRVVSLIHEQLVKTLSELPRKPLGISINPNTSAIKEINQTPDQPASVVYFKLSITEDALEINLRAPSDPSSKGDSKIKQLIPE